MMVNMKKLRAFLAGTIVTLCLTACGNEANIQEDNAREEMPETETVSEPLEQTESQDADKDGSRILIAYFSAGENSEVDVAASASVTVVDGEAKGRLRVVADMIQAETGGDLFSIQTSVEYPGDGRELIDYAAVEQDENARPELTNHIENPDDYDVIFVGYPNWWADLPMVMYSFFDEYDFSGKTIIPFNVHNGSRFSGTIATIQELEPDAKVITEGFTVSESVVADAAEDVAEWLRSLGY